ncbi:glycosyl transferase [Vibrio sp. MACH09]|uniref:glycosyltransferase n=1 Tax=Vibrio sp. MACH09 TaxID=3025122 RepID=UPI0027937838|nr:glycosyltransferase [Vibrio sp. MACH09]GLO59652.1 glycosyl transferase [Vibrio sp. MACH09]
MKILYIITGLGVGGAEIQLKNIVDKLVMLDHDVHIISLVDPVIIKPESNKVCITCLDMKKNLVSFLVSLLRIRKVIIRYRPDVVHSHMVHANLIVRVCRLFTRIKFLVCTAHSNIEGGRLIKFFYRITNGLCDVFSHVSHSGIKKFECDSVVRSNEMICIENGIDLNRFQKKNKSIVKTIRDKLNIADSQYMLLAVGSFKEAKDYPNLIRCLEHLKRRKLPVVLVIIGDGHLKDDISELIIQLDLVDDVRLIGQTHDVENYMSAADCFVLSSRWEGFGMVVAEAMACKCPIVITECGGAPEVAGEVGITVPINDSTKLADAIYQVYTMEEEKLNYILEKGRLRVMENFCLDSIVGRWLKVYLNKK